MRCACYSSWPQCLPWPAIKYDPRTLCMHRVKRPAVMSDVAQPLTGEHAFLACMETLQHVLLPQLTARDLFMLSCTSRAMQQWLLNSPPHLWQVCKHIAQMHGSQPVQPVAAAWYCTWHMQAASMYAQHAILLQACPLPSSQIPAGSRTCSYLTMLLSAGRAYKGCGPRLPCQPAHSSSCADCAAQGSQS